MAQRVACARMMHALVSQDQEFLNTDRPPTNFYELQMQHASIRGSEWIGSYDEQEPPVTVMCITCIGRYYQLRAALIYNLIIAWGFRSVVKFCLVMWGSDEGDIAEIARDCELFIDEECLFVASGGEAGRNQCLGSTATSSSATSAPCRLGPSLVPGWQQLQSWQASVCKNAAHVFGQHIANVSGWALQAFVSLDADNLMTSLYISAVYDFARELKSDVAKRRGSVLVPGTECTSGTCGRLAYAPSEFFAIGGYDQCFLPVGFQDVDLKRRLLHRGCNNAHKVVKTLKLTEIGGAIPNDANSKKSDRGSAKISCVDQSVTNQSEFSSWGKMNALNVSAGKAKLARGEIIRNAEIDRQAGARLGCWWQHLPRRALESLRLDLTDAPVMTEQANMDQSIKSEEASLPRSSTFADMPREGSAASSSADRIPEQWSIPPFDMPPTRCPHTRTPDPPPLRVRFYVAGLWRPPVDAEMGARILTMLVEFKTHLQQ